MIADRLDTLGFTPAVAFELLGEAFAEEREQKVGFIADREMGAELRAHYDAEVARLDGYTPEQWIADVRAAATSGERGGVMDLGSLAWLLDIAGFDPRVKLRAALLAWPEAGVRLDVTDDWDAEQGNGCSAALETLRVIGAEHAPIVVLPRAGRTSRYFSLLWNCSIRTSLTSSGSWTSARGRWAERDLWSIWSVRSQRQALLTELSPSSTMTLRPPMRYVTSTCRASRRTSTYANIPS